MCCQVFKENYVERLDNTAEPEKDHTLTVSA
jgi:hypothetical protein